MSLGLPVLPPLKVRRTQSGFYLYTYDHKWIPATKGPNGEVIKKGHTDISNKKIVGTLIVGDETKFAVFYEEFIEAYPEMRHYIAFRKEDNSWEFTLIAELNSCIPKDKLVLDYFNQSRKYSLNAEGEISFNAPKSQTSVPKAADVSSTTAKRGRPAKTKQAVRSTRGLWNLSDPVHAGTIALMEEVARATGFSESLQKALKKALQNSNPPYSDEESNELLTSLQNLVMYMAIAGNSEQ